MTVDPVLEKLRAGDYEGAWSLFMDRHRRLLFAVVRRYVTDPDDVMDVFAHVCDHLRADDLARLKRYSTDDGLRASFSTWLVVVARHLVIDWLRARDGRPRAAVPDGLSPLGRRIYDCMFVHGYSQRETRELVLGSAGPDTSAEFVAALRAVHRAVFAIGHPSPVRGHTAVALAEDLVDPSTLIEPAVDTRSILAGMLNGLDAEIRVAVQLFVVEEMAAADVARALGWPSAKVVYNRVYRALAAMRENFAKRGIARDDL
jgi:RNA polymerase sigma factor (sigma-70 family)